LAISNLQSSRDFFRIWFYWKKPAIILFIALVSITGIYSLFAPPKYESVAKLVVLPKPDDAETVYGSVAAGFKEARIKEVTVQDVATEMEFVSSPAVLSEAAKQLLEKGIWAEDDDEVADVVADLGKALKTQMVFESQVIDVKLRDKNPATAQKILQTVLDVYMSQRAQAYVKKDGFSFYQDQAGSYKAKLDEAAERLNEFQRSEDIVNLAGQNQANIELLSKLNNELHLLEIEYDGLQRRTEMLKKSIADNSDNIDLTKEMRQIPAIWELNKGIVPLLIKRSEIGTTFTANSREYRDIDNRISLLREDIRTEVIRAIRTDELELDGMKIKIDSLRDRINLLSRQANEFGQKSKMIENLNNQVALYRDSYILYSKKTEDAKVESEKNTRNLGNVNIFSAPSYSPKRVAPKPLFLMIGAVLGGLLLGLFLPFVLEAVDSKIKTSEDIEVLLDIPVISTFKDVEQNG
jgi:uncharacterized protein involved in exopolysaccharide biosynthesis